MRLLEEIIDCRGRNDRFELFYIQDCHNGKSNFAELEIRKEIKEIVRRSEMPERHIRVLMGGDINDVIKPNDIRFDFNEIANWLFEGDADCIKDKLNDVAKAQVKHSVKLFDPIRNLVLGDLEANHDKAVRKRYNTDTHKDFCKELGIEDLTDEAIVRFTFKRHTPNGYATSVVKLYMRHGYGSGRSPGAEPSKIAAMMADGVGADCDICITGHTHTYCAPAPIPVLYTPNRGKLPGRLPCRYRFGVNPGCWLYSHLVGRGTYESAACYPTRALMTCKFVIWPFWTYYVNGQQVEVVKIEKREYPIL